ncbi:MAG TPA: nitrite reductase large subunit NirB [Acidimicrobiales bacterium]|nr:nitrite reductase large subunit NirB [Acidimicrobiales bacterium]
MTDDTANGNGDGHRPAGAPARPVLVVAGNGMVGHQFLESAVERGLHRSHEIVVLGEEPRPAYDRVHLTSALEGADPAALRLGGEDFHTVHGVRLLLGQRAEAIDPSGRTVTTTSAGTLRYDHLVLATGSAPFVPPVPGSDLAGVFVYRTLDDVDAIRSWATQCRRGVVIGGGLLGLEAAGALRALGVHTTVVELADRLMAVQLDAQGGRALRRRIEGLGIDVLTGVAAGEVLGTHDGRVAGLSFGDGEGAPGPLDAEIVVFAAGIRPRDELARAAGLTMGERGGVAVDDTLATSDPHISAIGEVAAHRGGRPYGLVSPGYQQADHLATRLAGGTAAFTGADTSTKLKLLGVDVASLGDCFAMSDGAEEITWSDPVAGVYKKLVVSADGTRILGGILVGDAEAYGALLPYVRGGLPAPASPERLILPAGDGAAAGLTPADLPDAATICSCHNVTKGAICAAVTDGDLADVGAVKGCTRAGTGCGSCVPVLAELLNDELRKAGKEVVTRLCEHFPQTRVELFEIVRVTGLRTFAELIDRFGTGHGCEICKPAVASMFASLASGYILDGEQASLQDTNDHFLANLQRDGTYSIVPRVPGGEITPAQLIALGEVGREFDLYTKITGAQRVDLFGARVDQLPAIWARLIDAGFESGHAYGKAVRTVKSCVGDTWCRYGVQDSVAMAIRLELRYRGLRAPHKLKFAVSGCARECAEAQSKDVGVIATERGWNLYVGGNGGMRPQHAVLLAEDLDDEALVRTIDRYLMYYVRTAERLERTATWLNKLEGGLAHLQAVVVDDSLGVCADLEADMARHVESYECEWRATLADPVRMERFRPFLNSDEPDPSLAYVRVRGQRQPVELRPGRVAVVDRPADTEVSR